MTDEIKEKPKEKTSLLIRDIPRTLNKMLKIEQATKGAKNMSETIINSLKDYFNLKGWKEEDFKDEVKDGKETA